MRFRRYLAGESHPLHHDNYQIGDASLVATAMLCLTDTEEGGETYFPQAQPSPVLLQPRKGRLILWFNHQPDGEVDEAALHEALVVKKGEKATLTSFIYHPLPSCKGDSVRDGLVEKQNSQLIPLKESRNGLGAFGSLKPGSGRRFFCVNDDVPEESIN